MMVEALNAKPTVLCNFVPVMANLFEPELKLRVSPSIPYDAYSSFELNVEQDPEIDAGHLTMAPPGWLVEGWSSSNPAPPPTAVPFRSKKSQWLTTFRGRIEEGAHGINFVLQYLGGGFASGATKLDQAVGDGTGTDGFEIIHQLLRATILLPFWDDQVKLRFREAEVRIRGEAGPPGIGLYLEERLATQLAANSSFSFNDTADEGILIARREVRL